MDADRILPVNREHLLLMQVLCWLAPGIKILVIGIKALLQVQAESPERTWWLMLITLAVTVAFSAMFHKFIIRYTKRILDFTERKKSLFAFFDLRGYILIFFMMGLGIFLKLIPGIPSEFFAGFYPGLGAALSIAGIRYLASWWKALKTEARKCGGKYL